MSRVIHVNAIQSDVLALCAKHGAPVTAHEPLLSGGTRVVLSNAIATAAMKRVFGKLVVSGDVKRKPLRLRG